MMVSVGIGRARNVGPIRNAASGMIGSMRDAPSSTTLDLPGSVALTPVETRRARARQRLWARLQRTAARLEHTFDRARDSLRRRFGHVGPLSILTYRGFGNRERITVLGRLVEARTISLPQPSDSRWQNVMRVSSATSTRARCPRPRWRCGSPGPPSACAPTRRDTSASEFARPPLPAAAGDGGDELAPGGPGAVRLPAARLGAAGHPDRGADPQPARHAGHRQRHRRHRPADPRHPAPAHVVGHVLAQRPHPAAVPGHDRSVPGAGRRPDGDGPQPGVLRLEEPLEPVRLPGGVPGQAPAAARAADAARSGRRHRSAAGLQERLHRRGVRHLSRSCRSC